MHLQSKYALDTICGSRGIICIGNNGFAKAFNDDANC